MPLPQAASSDPLDKLSIGISPLTGLFIQASGPHLHSRFIAIISFQHKNCSPFAPQTQAIRAASVSNACIQVFCEKIKYDGSPQLPN